MRASHLAPARHFPQASRVLPRDPQNTLRRAARIFFIEKRQFFISAKGAADA